MRDDPFRPGTSPSGPTDAGVGGDVTREFWGSEQAWGPRRRDAGVRSERPRSDRPVSAPRAGLAGDLTAAFRAVREGIAAFRPQTLDPSGRPGRSRYHGPSGEAAPEAFHVPVEQCSGTDPLLRRAGVATLLTVVLVPLALAARPDAAATTADLVRALPPVTTPVTVAVTSATGPATAPVPDPVAPVAVAPTPAAPAPAAAQDTGTADQVAPEPRPEPQDDADPVEEWTRTESASSGAAAGVDEGAETDEPATRVGRDCDQHYTVAPGDSWYRIADAAGMTPDELLAANNATLDTVLYPGDSVCLPADATMPTPPSTTSPPPSTTDAPAPSTTETPTDDDPVEPLDPSEVQDLIRATWPADQVDKALAIAWRESNYIATADNGWCCVGVFQIYWTVHQGWLDEFGIHERDDLKDARKNIAAAYAMWQRSGWGPWGG